MVFKESTMVTLAVSSGYLVSVNIFVILSYNSRTSRFAVFVPMSEMLWSQLISLLHTTDLNSSKDIPDRIFKQRTECALRGYVTHIPDSDGFCGFQKMSEETYSSFAPSRLGVLASWRLGVSLI
ncbi:MAG: hypothetical protein C5S47_02640 [Candidatus Methanogasteraceae archaeon]|nr:MAG: hypothetical protein C5S47_02640 [ANME-2 cluster archaeon]